MTKYRMFLPFLLLTIEAISTSLSVPIPVSNTHFPAAQQQRMPVLSEINLKNKRSYDGELDFPDNYDYEFSDMGDFFDDYPDPQNPQSPQKRYSDAMAMDMHGRLERLRLMKARNKFLQMIMGKRSDTPLTGLVEMLRQKQRDQNGRVSDALENLKMLNVLPREAEQEREGGRVRRHAEGAYTSRAGVLARLKAEAVKREFEKDIIGDYFDRTLRTPEFLRALILSES